MKRTKTSKILDALLVVVWALYSVFLGLQIYIEWPTSYGWIVAATWFALCIWQQRMFRKMGDGWSKLCHEIIESWEQSNADHIKYQNSLKTQISEKQGVIDAMLAPVKIQIAPVKPNKRAGGGRR